MSVLYIDASNIIIGGGLLHLQKIISCVDPLAFGFSKLVIWANKNTLEQLPNRPWLDLREIPPAFNAPLSRIIWQRYHLDRYARSECDLLFFPGGIYLGNEKPFVTLLQNMQIFETVEANREFFSREWLRLIALRRLQTKTFKNAAGIIFLSRHSHEYFKNHYSSLMFNSYSRVIAHGSDPKMENISEKHSTSKVLKVLCVSTIKQYKHQWNLVEAISRLNQEGLSLELHLVGAGDAGALRKLAYSISRAPSNTIFYHGGLDYSSVFKHYADADIFAFPSTCETFGISLLEAMISGLPIACSDRGPMPEILRDAGLYFDSESVDSIVACLRRIAGDADLRLRLGRRALIYAKTYQWEDCANETFAFFSSILNRQSL